jgi:phage baseplate assembly protein W
MSIPQTIRVNPLDLQKNIAIGVSLPFNGPGVFNSTFTTKDQIKSNLVNLLLTSTGERIMNPNFGTFLKRFLFEGITDSNLESLKDNLLNSISIYIPDITVTGITITPNTDYNSIDLNIDYIVNISQSPDQVTVQFT